MRAGVRAGNAKSVDLGQVSLPRLLFALLHQRFTGTVELRQPPPHEGDRTIWFRGGMPVFTDWLEPPDVLGQVLSELSIIDEAALMQALQTMAREGGLLGEILLRQGAITHEQLVEGLRRQCMRKLSRLFALRSGTLVVTPGTPSTGKDLREVNVLELILAGVGAHFDEARIEAELGAALHGPVIATAALQKYHSHFRFRPGDEPALRALSAGTRLETLAGMGGMSRRRGAQLIYALWACQMLKVGAAVTEATPVAAATQPRPRTPVPSAAARVATPFRPEDAAPPPVRPSAKAGSTPPSSRPTPAAFSGASPPPSPAPGAQASSTRRQHTELDLSIASAAAKRDEAAEPPSDEAAAFSRELEEIEKKIAQGANAFALLGVSLDAGKKEIRRAWGDLSRKFHPDALQAKGLGHMRERVSKAFAALSEAHMALGDKEKREQLRQAIERGENPQPGGPDASAVARAAFESELIAKEADKLLKAGKFDRAAHRYRDALALTPDEPDLHAALAWCEYNLSNKSRDAAVTAEHALGDIVAHTPSLARAHYFRGLVLKDLRAFDTAIIAFTKALEHDPRLIDAERQIRALRLTTGTSRPPSSQDADKPRRGLRGLFKR